MSPFVYGIACITLSLELGIFLCVATKIGKVSVS